MRCRPFATVRAPGGAGSQPFSTHRSRAVGWLAAAIASLSAVAGSAVPTVDLALDQHHAALYGPHPDDRIPYERVITSGDLNNDGYADIAFGTLSGDSPTVADVGAVHVVFGPIAPGLRQDLATSPADVTLYGASSLILFGHLPRAVDVSGDAIDDLVLTAHGADNPGSCVNCGAVYVFFGPLTPGVIDLATAVPDVQIYGSDNDDWFGRHLVTGDINDDGFPDIVAAVARGDGPGNTRTDVGEVLVVFGPFTSGTVIDLATTPPDAIIYGVDPGDEFGYEITVGDVSGDGVDDIATYSVFGAGPGNARPRCGDVHILFGPLASGTVVDLATTPADVAIYGAADLHYAGRSIAIGDLSGDGNTDLALGSSAPFEPSGVTHVFFSPLSAGTTIDLASQVADVIVSGRETLGARLWIDDITHDGAPDLVITSSHPLAPLYWSGVVEVFAGPFASATTIDVATATPALRVIGADQGDLAGYALGSGDVTGDNLAELFVGAAQGDGPGNTRVAAGEVHVIRLEDAINLAVQFDLVQATRRGEVIDIEWVTSQEVDTVAFIVERADDRNGPFAAIGGPVAARGGGQRYTVHDSMEVGRPWYRVVEYTTAGRGDESPVVQPQDEVTGPGGQRSRDAGHERRR